MNSSIKGIDNIEGLSSNRIHNQEYQYTINGCWVYDANNQTVSKKTGEIFSLRAKTAAVLDLLLKNNHHVVGNEIFLEKIWHGRCVSENVLKQSVSELRSILDDKERNIISTAPKKGYYLNAEVHRSSPVVTVEHQYDQNFKQVSENLQQHFSRLDTESLSHKKHPKPFLSSFVFYRFFNDVFKSDSKQRVKNFSIKNICSYRGLSVFLLVLIVTGSWLFSKYVKDILNQKETYRLEIAQLDANIALTLDVFSDFYRLARTDSLLFSELLKKSTIKTNLENHSSEKQQGYFKALLKLYDLNGSYNDSRLILGRLLENTESFYGAYSQEYFEVKFKVVMNLIELLQRQEAYNLAKVTLNLARKYQEHNNALMARAYQIAARAYLFCVEPYCKRSHSLADGENYTLRSQQLIKEVHGDQSEEFADSLTLLNWFVWDKHKKVALMERALSIYMNTLGFYHKKTATALEDLGRTHAFFFSNWLLAEQHLLDAMKIKEKIYVNGHPHLAKIYGYLSEYYLMKSEFDLSIIYSEKYLQMTVINGGENDDYFLEKLMFKAKAHFYQQEFETAKQTIDRVFDIIQKNKLTPVEQIYLGLMAARERINLEFKKNVMSYE
ncbi:MAG: winged helix-turn-helix domain-containing protein, partial [Pseudomonadota bacterium]